MKISQREAVRLRKENKGLRREINELKSQIRNQRYHWRNNASSGKEIFHLEGPLLTSVWAVATARKLGHAVIAEDYGNGLKLYALPLPSEPA